MAFTRRSGKIILGLLVIALSLFAVSSSMAAPKLQVLQTKYWVEEVNEYLKGLAEEWGRKNGVDVDYSIVSEAEYYTKFAMITEAQKGTDIIMYAHTNGILAQEVMLDVSDLAEELQGEVGLYPAGQIDYVYTGERWIGIPMWEVLHGVYFRSDWFAEAGLPTRIPFYWTYDQMLDYSLKITDPSKGRWGGGMVLSTCPDAQGFQLGAIWNFGGSLWARDGKTVTVNSIETLNAVKWLKDFYTRTSPPGIAGWDCGANNRAFLANKIGMTENAPSIYAAALKDQPELAEVIEFAMHPFGPNGSNFDTAESWGWMILKSTKYPDEAKDLIRYMSQKERLIQLFTVARGGLYPATMNPEFFDLPVFPAKMAPFANCIKYGTGKTFTWPARITRPLAEIITSDLVAKHITNVVLGKRTPKQALEDAQKEYKQIIARYAK